MAVVIDSAIEVLAKAWFNLYKLRPLLTGVSTGVIVGSLVAGVSYLDHLDKKTRETFRLENLDYQKQMDQLTQTESNIRQLLIFVDTQKKSLKETEDTISKLKSEKEKLQPLVETDRAVLEAIFKAQEDRASSNVWRERWIGFGLGVAASLIASFIWFVAGFFIRGTGNRALE
jgi:gas vesicle protein